VGTGKTVSVAGISAAGTDSGNYTLSNTTATTVADITPALLTVAANNATKQASSINPPLTGLISGFVGTDTLSNATIGTTEYTTSATTTSAPGSYIITASVLPVANNTNYVFTNVDAVLTVIGPHNKPLDENQSTAPSIQSILFSNELFNPISAPCKNSGFYLSTRFSLLPYLNVSASSKKCAFRKNNGILKVIDDGFRFPLTFKSK